MAPSRPCMSGLPGRMAMRQKPSSMPGRDERLLHEIVIADRGAAERHQHVGFGVARLSHRRLQRADSSTAMPRSIATPPHASTTPATAKLFEAMICEGPSAPPGATSSSPVARIATRARRRTPSAT